LILQASQHGEHKAEQTPPQRGRRRRRRRGGTRGELGLGAGYVRRAAGGVLEEGRHAAADAVEPAAVGRGGAGGVRGVPGRVPRGRRPGAPPLRPSLPLGMRGALARGHLPLPLLPRRRRRQPTRRSLGPPAGRLGQR
jgi:hypothetical protein